MPSFPQPEGRGPNGRRFCRVCHEEVAPRRSSFCSDACVQTFLWAANWGFIRSRVLERDRGVCARCAVDCLALAYVVREQFYPYQYPTCGPEKRNRFGWTLQERLEVWAAFCRGWQIHPRGTRDLWEADHIVPVVDGGTHELANLRTLCVPCHRFETAQLARRRRRPLGVPLVVDPTMPPGTVDVCSPRQRVRIVNVAEACA